MRTLSFALVLSLFAGRAAPASPPSEFFDQHCAHCHAGDTANAEINLEAMPQDWADHATVALWERVLDAVESGTMPPKEEAQPSSADRKTAAAALEAMLLEKSPVGGTVLQRLNRVQYANTVSQLFGFAFELPAEFPADASSHGFDRIADGLVLSPPLMEQYLDVATRLADEVAPPPASEMKVDPRLVELEADDFSVSFEGSKLHGADGDRRLRLISRHEVLVRGSTWATRFDAKFNGEYEIRARLSAFEPATDEPLVVHLLAVKSGADFVSVYDQRTLAEFDIPADGMAHDVVVRAALNQGETIAFHWANSDFGWDRDGQAEAARQLRSFLSDPKTHAAWLKIGRDRGRSPAEGWRQLKESMAGGELDLDDPRLKELPARFDPTLENELKYIVENMRHELGPGMDLRSASVNGPLKLIEGDEDRARRLRSARFLGERAGRSDAEWIEDILREFLTRAFRRPVSDEKLAAFTRLALDHIAEGNGFDSAAHLCVRAALVSPEFLYLNSAPGPLDDFGLAARLSYFLTAGPPDESLFAHAARGELSDPKVLESETRRLIASHSRAFVTDFTGQWLRTNTLADIMPDPRLLKFKQENEGRGMIAETEMFFTEIVTENLPLETFIAPTFTFMNDRLATNIYDFEFRPRVAAEAATEGRERNRDEMRRVDVPQFGHIGGVLGQASVMMATANGVDTEPVLRGVWLLENVFGTPVPPPPKNVPAIAPDTAAAKSIRERLAAHQADTSCASCHSKIDPLGFALENFDPVGRWREFYPIYETDKRGEVVTLDGARVDAAGSLPDGTPIHDVTDLKRYLVQNPDIFARCLAGKLLMYATGRAMSHGDKRVIERIILDAKQRGNGFADLIVAAVASEVFRAR